MRIKRSLSAIIAVILLAAPPAVASAQVSLGVAVGFGGPGWGVGFSAYSPPAIPAYYQPTAPYPGWQWAPGYWAWSSYGYYWVPGYWTAPPAVGLYWTPGYWGWAGGGYSWYPGYWGPTVGFYGGINYGFGYFGTGFVGGYWSGGVFNYNTAVVNVNRTVIRNTYVNRTVTHGTVTDPRTSFNGGHGGVRARPTAAQVAARRDGIAGTAAQRANARVAARDRNMLASVNHGRPRVAAVQRPLSATNRPSDMHSITAADRAAAHRTMHGSLAAAHRTAPTTAAHHSETVSAAHHSAPTTAAHHSETVSAAHHSAPTSAAHYASSAHGGGYHGAYGGGGGYHRAYGGGGGYPHGAAYGGSPHGGSFGHQGGGGMGGGGRSGGGGRPPR
jgi:hypothetical protein